jgi:gliding motility-associated-like protein
LTLKRLIILTALLVLALAVTAQNYNNIEFIENKGQWDKRVKFKGDVSTGAFFIRSGGFTVLQHDPKDIQGVYDMIHGHNVSGVPPPPTKSVLLRSHAYNVDFVGASAQMQVVPDKPLPTYNNYFIGNDPAKWGGDCRIFQAITLKDVYDNVDVRYYTNNGVLKYDIIVKPGADISKIALRYDGVEKLQVKNKQLLVGTSVGELKESAPYTYQANAKGQREVNCKYVIKNNIVRFEVKDYDPASTLIIDPTLIFCSFAGSVANNWGFTATYGPDGSMYGGGIVFSNGFPVSVGAFQTTYQGGTDGFGEGFDIGLIKLSPDGSNRIYATYLGGALGNEFPQSLIVDQQGELIVAGRSSSSDYPLMPITNKVGDGGAFDITVTKLNAAGTGLIGSIKIGGTQDDGANITAYGGGANSLQQNYGDEARSEVNLDGAGNIYLASCTQSIAGDDGKGGFPVQGGFQAISGGAQDGVVIKFPADLSSVLFSSYLGGGGNDAAYVVSIDPLNGNIYVGGGTASTNLPGPTAGTIGPANNLNSNAATIDGFVSIISSDGSAILKTTYLGTNGIDQVYGIQFDKNNFPYVMGQTTGAWPIVNAPYFVTGAKQFIAKLQPDLSAYVYSTVFGTPNAGSPNISPVAFLVDRCDNVYVSGWGGLGNTGQRFLSTGTLGLPVTPDAIQSNTDGNDFYFFVLKKDAASQLYGSFFGQVGGDYPDHVDGGTSRFDRDGVIYQAVCGNCGGGTSFPTTTGAWSETKPPAAYCNLALVKIAFNLAGVASGIQSAINGVPRDTAGCVPLTVDFSDTVRNAQSYIWDFGDGSPSVSTTNFTISHIYTTTGTFPVSLIAIDSTSCNIRDTSYLDIRVGDLRATVDFTPVKLPPCDSFNYRFDNLSLAPPIRPFGSLSFTWDFGDDSPQVTSDNSSVVHSYSGPGTYKVTLVLADTSYCNSPDSMTFTLNVAANVKAQFTTPPTGCVPYNAVFTNTSLAGQTFEWDFGDGTTSTQASPTHLYPAAGPYTIRLVANDPNTCNLTDTTYFTINVADIPVADYSYSPNPPVENTPTNFTNLSSPDAILFKWDFGDGDTLQTASRLPVQHQYNATGSFNVCLTAFNAAGCSDTACQQVLTLIKTLVDVPNAFTPQSGDINSVVLVRGFGIAKMKFIIWNRWGQKVFETGNRFQGWDGKVKGVVQPMDVYAYTLEVEFFDGTKTNKKGDITLIR